MPKKTKKEKLLASYRKKLKLLERQTLPIKAPLLINRVVPIKKEIQITSYFLNDLKKSLFLIGVIIALEISLYFVRIIK